MFRVDEALFTSVFLCKLLDATLFQGVSEADEYFQDFADE